MGLVQGAPCKIEVDLKDATGGRYKPVALVKNKANDAEELPLYSDKDTVMGEVRLGGGWKCQGCNTFISTPAAPCAKPFQLKLFYPATSNVRLTARGMAVSNAATFFSNLFLQNPGSVSLSILPPSRRRISPQVRLTPTPGRKMEHQGIKIQLIGRIELASERGTRHDFVSLTRELAPPGDLSATRAFPFEFRNVEMQYESYRGIQVRCR